MSRIQEKILKSSRTIYVGVDVGKTMLDIHLHPDGEHFQTPNTQSGIRAIVRRLSSREVTLVVMEATGSYHRLAHRVLHEAGLRVAVVNPFRSRQFADSLGNLAKTDTIDAHALALFGERLNPLTSVPPNEHAEQLRALQCARRQVVKEVADLKRQLHTTEHMLAARQIRARIVVGERHRAELEKEINVIIKSHDDLKQRFDILTSIPGIGATTAAILLADLTELGAANARQISALAGVAPMNWDSGAKHGKRMIRGGRAHVRRALYMCAVTCIRRSDHLGRTYQNLVRRGKNPKVALTAVMRKLIILANTLIAENRTWQAQAPASAI